MPTDEELVELARTYPAFKHHLTDPNKPFTTPPPPLDLTPRLPEPTTDDRPLEEKYPALRTHRDPALAKQIALQGGLYPATPTNEEE